MFFFEPRVWKGWESSECQNRGDVFGSRKVPPLLNYSFFFNRIGDTFSKCRRPGGLRAPHTAYGDAPNNVQQISRYKNHGKKIMVMITLIISLSYHIVSCHTTVIVISLKTLACIERCVYEEKKKNLIGRGQVRHAWRKVWGTRRARCTVYVLRVFVCSRLCAMNFHRRYERREIAWEA